MFPSLCLQQGNLEPDVYPALKMCRDVRDGPVVKNLPSSTGTRVQALVRAVRPHMQWGS